MSKKVFQDGSVLTTGQEMIDVLEALYNHRGAFDRTCDFCVHEDNTEGFCDGCSISDWELSCSCHINPPCQKCVESKFDVSPYLINYKNHKNGREKWECFKGDKELVDKLAEIESAGLILSAEILTTGEVAMYIDDGIDADENDSIEICQKREFKQTMCKMILAWKRVNSG